MGEKYGKPARLNQTQTPAPPMLNFPNQFRPPFLDKTGKLIIFRGNDRKAKVAGEFPPKQPFRHYESPHSACLPKCNKS